MSIDKAASVGSYATPGQSGPTAYAPEKQAPQTQAKTWGFMGLGNVGGISRTPSSEALSKAATVIIEAFNKLSVSDKYDLHLLKVDNTKETQLRLSSCVAVAINKTTRDLSYHTVILEASSEQMPPRIETINGKQVTIRRYASDVFDKDYSDAVAGLVDRAFPNCKIRDCSAVVCPRNFNWEDKEAVRQFVNNIVLPCIANLEERSLEFMELDLTKFNRDSQLQTQVMFNEPTRTDYTGHPVRSDITIVLSAVNNAQQNNQTLNNQDRSQLVAETSGFIDLLWFPVEQQQNYNVMAPQATQKYAARFVMTGMENQLRMTLAAQLLALSSVLTLGEGNNYYPHFAPRPVGAGRNTVDLRDIGAINIEANLEKDPSGYGKKFDTKLTTFDQIALGTLIQSTIRPGLMFSLDISACGSDTWYNEPFAAAAAGQRWAQDLIVKAANDLTGGYFAKYYQQSATPVLINDERILLGYYTAQDGTRRDIRDIDNLAVMNAVGEHDPKAPQAWSDTFQRLDFPLPIRLAEREKMIQNIVQSEVLFTQPGQRITYTLEFVTAFSQACRDAGLTMKVINPALQGDYANNRGVASWASQTTTGPLNTGLFQSGYGNAQAASQQRYYASRY